MANRPPKVPHLVGTTRILNLEDVYANIGNICGISKITGPVPDGAETGTIRAMIANGSIRRATVRLANKKTRIVYMAAANCPQVGALVGLEYQTGIIIKSASFSQQITLG